ncbi:hypothetical protein [Gallibacterium anatis]|uniref:hypothetical protein n=1 Tax=Gallibacterium anatis TaxID=750 RepID=UPI0018AF5EDF|nr:hypothetical protein [Gallibacterium anatis]
MAYYTYIFCLGKGFVEVFAVALPCIDILVPLKGRFHFFVVSLGFDLKVDFILLRLRLALILWFRPKGDPILLRLRLALRAVAKATFNP